MTFMQMLVSAEWNIVSIVISVTIFFVSDKRK